MPKPSAPLLTLFFALYGVAVGLYAQFDPQFAAGLFRLDISSNDAAIVALRVFSGRKVALGLSTLLIWYLKEWRALGVVLGTMAISAGVDCAVVATTHCWGEQRDGAGEPRGRGYGVGGRGLGVCELMGRSWFWRTGRLHMGFAMRASMVSKGCELEHYRHDELTFY